jgi:hypothetical protein
MSNGGNFMNLQEYLDDIESTCRNCKACDSSYACHLFKNCLKSELEVKEVMNCKEESVA